MTRLLVLQHIACEPPGAYEDELLERGGSLARVMVDRGEPLPDWREFDGIVAMGGPMGAYEETDFSWLMAEKRCSRTRWPTGCRFGACASGRSCWPQASAPTVFAGETPEVGVLAVHRTAAAASDPVFALLPEEFRALQWHGDTFTLPPGAVQLARSDAYEQQAFVVDGAYGIQFHIEVGADLADEWAAVPAYAASLEAIMGAGALPRLVGELVEHEQQMTTLARALFGAWLDRVVGGASLRSASVGPLQPVRTGTASP